MSYQPLDLGSAANDGTGDTLRASGDKINDNFSEIYTLLGDGTSLSSGISATATVVTLTAPTISGVVGGTITSATITTLTGTTFNAGTLALAAGSITDSSGAISFGNENLTTTGSVTAASLDISGDVDIDGTLETDALTIDGVSLAETISDTVGAMVSSNTETNITVTYDDTTNTLDFAVDLSGVVATTATTLATARTIHGVSFDGSANIDLTEVVQDTVGAMFGSNTETGITVSYEDGDGTIDLVVGTLNQDTTGTAAKVTVTDSTANTNFPVTFHDESNALLDDTGALRYNPSTGTLLVPNLVVAGTTTQVDTVTMNAENAVIFEGATADDHETTLTIIDPTADRTQRLLNQSGYIPLLAAVTTTAITSTPEELNILDGATVVVGEINALDLGSTAVGTAIASKAVILDSNKDYSGIRNLTISGEIDAATGDFSGAVDIAGATTTAAITASGVIKTDNTTEATSTTDGSLQTDGGLSVVKDIVAGDDVKLLSDASVIHFGANSEVTNRT